jgi:hypothetical protein
VFDRQQPLTDRELRIIRGMIDEYDLRTRSRLVWRGRVRDVRVLLAVVGAAILIVLQSVELVFLLGGHH